MADHMSQSRLLLRVMSAKDADPLSVTAPADFMKRSKTASERSDNSAPGQKLQTLAKGPQPFRITVEDAEVVKEPFSVTFKLAIHSAKGDHRLNKSYNDLERLGKAIIEELPTVMLPRLPRPHAHEQLVDRGFRARLDAYLVCLACTQGVVETFAFNNFFQLADDTQRRWQMVRSAMQQAPTQDTAARVGHALLAGALGSIGSESGFDRQQEAKPVSFPPTRAVPAGSAESHSTSSPHVVFAASAFRSVAAGRQGAGERRRAQTSSGKLPMQGGAGMGGSISPVSGSMAPRIGGSIGLVSGSMPPRMDGSICPVSGSMNPGSPVNLSMSMGLLPAGPQERVQADSETPHTGAGRLHASAREGRPATSPTVQASTQAPLDSRVSQGPTSPSEPSETPAIRRPHRRKTTKLRAFCVVCLENPQEMAIDPCGHMSMCEECMKSVKDCPICRGPIHKAMKIIIAKRHLSGETTEYVS